MLYRHEDLGLNPCTHAESWLWAPVVTHSIVGGGHSRITRACWLPVWVQVQKETISQRNVSDKPVSDKGHLIRQMNIQYQEQTHIQKERLHIEYKSHMKYVILLNDTTSQLGQRNI